MLDQIIESFNRFVVRAYKAVGFVALFGILSGLISFFSVHMFYLFDRSWLAPVILSPSHQQVVEISAQIAQQSYQRDRLISERRQLDDDISDAQRRLRLQRSLVEEYAHLTAQALSASQRDHQDINALRSKVAARRRNLSADRSRFSSFVSEHLEAQREAGLLLESDAVKAEHQLSELQASEIVLDREEVEVDMEARRVEARNGALARLSREFSGASDADAALTPELIDLKRGFEEAELEALRLQAQLDRFDEQAGLLDETIGRYDRLLRELNGSPYLQALDEEITLAFVPYDNLATVDTGAPVYGCLLYLVGCRRVGEVVQVIDGEVSAQHPLTHDALRGLMVQVDIDEGSWARDEALFAGKRPFWVL